MRATSVQVADRFPKYHRSTNTEPRRTGMRIDVKGRNVAVSDELRRRIERRFEKVSRQVPSIAQLEVELCEERNPSIHDRCVAEATMHLKGVTLRARERSDSMVTAITLLEEDLSRQVKRHRDKRRARRDVPRVAPQAYPAP